MKKGMSQGTGWPRSWGASTKRRKGRRILVSMGRRGSLALKKKFFGRFEAAGKTARQHRIGPGWCGLGLGNVTGDGRALGGGVPGENQPPNAAGSARAYKPLRPPA